MPENDFLVVEKSGDSIQALESAQQNANYYYDNMDEIWKDHSGEIVLVYDGGTVESFNCLEDFGTRLDQLSAGIRASGMSFQRPKGGAWIL